MISYTHTDAAKFIRAALKLTYPRTKFSVRSESFSMGCAVRVSWTDGPLDSEVSEIYKAFEDATFDGMTDCKGYREPAEYQGEHCSFGGAWVTGSRTTSPNLLRIAAYRVHRETGLPLLPIETTSYGSGVVREGEYVVPFVHMTHCGYDNLAQTQAGDGEYYSRLVYSVARHTATERRAWLPELPVRLTPELIDERARQILGGAR